MSQIIPIYIPTLISDINYNPAKVYPRLFFYNGKVECQPYYFEHKTASGSAAIQTTEIGSFPYVDHYNVVTGSFPSADSKTLLFLNEEPVYGSAPSQSLYTEYWETYINLLYDPKTRLIDCSAIIPLADYYQMELNDLVEWRGNTYHLRAINDYDIKTGKCALQLLGPIIRDAQSQQLNCNFTFVSSDVATTTITPTGVPTTTLVPTTLVPTTTIAPTTLTPTTLTPTTLVPTTSVPTTTSTPTTLVPTTTIAPYVAYYTVIEGGETSGGNYTYLNEFNQLITGSLSTNQQIFVGAQTGSVTLTGAGSGIFYSQTIYNTVFPVNSYDCYTYFFKNDSLEYPNADKVAFYVPCGGTTLTYRFLQPTGPDDDWEYCVSYTGSAQIVGPLDSTMTNLGYCGTGTTTTTTITP